MGKLMEYRGFHANVNYDVESDVLVGEVFDSKDSIRFQASTINHLTVGFHRCVDEYIERCYEKGVNPHKEYDGVLELTLALETYRKAVLAANKQHITLDQFVENAIAKELHRS